MMTAVVREVEQVVTNPCMVSWPGVLGSGRNSGVMVTVKSRVKPWEMSWTLSYNWSLAGQSYFHDISEDRCCT